jgi:DNA-directed RNA polymerase specialized sigma24 family protein
MVQGQIESLTDNEDFRQDLWVAYLSGQHSLPSVFKQIQEQHDKVEEFQRRLHQYALSEQSHRVSQLLDNFSNPERSILYMIVLGYNVRDISDRYGTSQVRIYQALDAIQKHSIWNKLLVSV